ELVIAIALWNSVESISDLFGGLFQRLERMEYVGKANLVQLAPMCIAMILSMTLTHSMLWGAYGLVLAALVRLLGYEIPVTAKLLRENPKHSGQKVGRTFLPLQRSSVIRFLQLGTPLAIVTFLMAFTGSVPRYLIKDELSDARVGVYVALWQI